MLTTLAPGKYIREIFMSDLIDGLDSEYEAIVITGDRLAFCTYETFESFKEVKEFLKDLPQTVKEGDQWREISLDDNPDYLCQIICNID